MCLGSMDWNYDLLFNFIPRSTYSRWIAVSLSLGLRLIGKGIYFYKDIRSVRHLDGLVKTYIRQTVFDLISANCGFVAKMCYVHFYSFEKKHIFKFVLTIKNQIHK